METTNKKPRFGIIPKNAKLLDFASYYVTKDGLTVYSMISARPLKQALQKMTTGKPGYLKVWLLHKDGTSHWHSVHRLVAKLFVVNYKPSEYKEVGHKDNNKLNNHYKNLYWTDHVGNIRDAINSGVNIFGRNDPQRPSHMKGKKHKATTKALMSTAKLGMKHPKFKGWYKYAGLEYPSLNQLAQAIGTYAVKARRMFDRGEITFRAA